MEDWIVLPLAAFCVVFGTWLLYTANSQKYFYRIYGKEYKIHGKPVTTVGGRLLADGLLGYGRKMNYAGDILVYLGLSLCAGSLSYYPYMIVFFVLLFLGIRAK
jgi:steroid 5-alpha reductase family enzyme